MQYHCGSSARREEHVADEMRRVFFYRDSLLIVRYVDACVSFKAEGAKLDESNIAAHYLFEFEVAFFAGVFLMHHEILSVECS